MDKPLRSCATTRQLNAKEIWAVARNLTETECRAPPLLRDDARLPIF